MKKVIISGHLGRDAKINEVNGRFALNFSVAVNETYRDADGNKIERTTWFSATKWSNEKPKLAQYLTSGKQVIVEGIPEPSYYTGKDGKIVPQIDIRVMAIELIGSGKDKDGSNGGSAAAAAAAPVADDAGLSDIPPQMQGDAF